MQATPTVEAPALAQRHGRRYRRREPERSALYGVLHEHLQSFLALANSDDSGDGLPRFVENELRAFLDCGILQKGFARFRRQQCGHDRLVASSCKGRGFCPSCGGKRMTQLAAHLVDKVIPIVPTRQYVLSVPHALRKILEHILRYCARPPLSLERLQRLNDGRMRLALKSPWSDGTTHLVFEPLELIRRLTALIPLPHKNLLIYHGGLAPRAAWRSRAVAYGRPPCDNEAAETRHATTQGATPATSPAQRSTWATLMQRAFAIDVLDCPRCGKTG